MDQEMVDVVTKFRKYVHEIQNHTEELEIARTRAQKSALSR